MKPFPPLAEYLFVGTAWWIRPDSTQPCNAQQIGAFAAVPSSHPTHMTPSSPSSPIMMEGAVIRSYLLKMKRYRKTQLVSAVKVNRPFVIEQASSDAPINGRIEAVAGSYLALSPSGSVYAVPESVFESMYEEVTDE